MVLLRSWKERDGLADDISIARDMRSFLNQWSEKPVVFSIERLTTAPPAIMFQPLSGTKVLKRYVDGSFIGSWPFAICLRVNQTDTSVKLSAYDTLEKVSNWLTCGVLPELSGEKIPLEIEQTSTPSQIAVYEDGTEDYQALFALEYKQRKV